MKNYITIACLFFSSFSFTQSINFDGIDDAISIGPIHGSEDVIRFTNQFTLEA